MIAIPPSSSQAVVESTVELEQELKRKRKARRGTKKYRVLSKEKLTDNWHNENILLAELALSQGNLVELKGFDFPEFAERVARGQVPLKKGRVQPGLNPQRLSIQDGPRVVVDAYGNFVLAYFPKFWAEASRSRILEAIDNLIQVSPLKPDSQRQSDKRQGAVAGVEGKAAYWSIFQHGIAQHN
ncbi:hypothetical protein V565_310230, partial [Rhizoctonia solani 123E]